MVLGLMEIKDPHMVDCRKPETVKKRSPQKIVLGTLVANSILPVEVTSTMLPSQKETVCCKGIDFAHVIPIQTWLIRMMESKTP